MKSYKLIKALPILFTFIIVLLISLNNQKQDTKLTLLIWDTPKSSLGGYVAISTVSGFILSFLLMNNLAFNAKPRLNRVVKYRYEGHNENQSPSETIQKEISYEQTLIERNYRDPSPTMKAEFRVIGNVEKISRSFQKNQSNISNESVALSENEYQEEYETDNSKDYDFSDARNNADMDWENISYESW